MPRPDNPDITNGQATLAKIIEEISQEQGISKYQVELMVKAAYRKIKRGIEEREDKKFYMKSLGTFSLFKKPDFKKKSTESYNSDTSNPEESTEESK